MNLGIDAQKWELNCVYRIGSSSMKDVADKIQNFSIRVNLKNLDAGLDLTGPARFAYLEILIDSHRLPSNTTRDLSCLGRD